MPCPWDMVSEWWSWDSRQDFCKSSVFLDHLLSAVVPEHSWVIKTSAAGTDGHNQWGEGRRHTPT